MPERMISDDRLPQNGTDGELQVPNRLILCFDGTGNNFQGNTSDTNIVKLLEMFDRSTAHQMHYYQPGIGTYTADKSVNQSFFGRIKTSVSQTIDQGFATTFDAHVMAGYRFLMRYYKTGDKIYIFGFSRGAFTARFLARMVSSVGLLSMGNEEMVPFAYKVYQDYEVGANNAEQYMKTFRVAFCRHGPEEIDNSASQQAGVKVYFLGLFDTVNSVGTLDIPFKGKMKAPDVTGTAEHVRHAVAIDERRVKFKAALLAQDRFTGLSLKEDMKEVWFPGNHGDIGGGWPAENEQPKRSLSLSQRLKRIFQTATDDAAHFDKSRDWFQLSDIALKWMIDELDNVSGDRVNWNEMNKHSFLTRFAHNRSKAINARMHDTLTFGGGSSFGKVAFWKLLEYLPFIRRWEYFPRSPSTPWQYVRFPLNKGASRDIPTNALFHHSVLERMWNFPISTSASDEAGYQPSNDVSVQTRSWKLSEASPPKVASGAAGEGLPKSEPYFTFCEAKTVGSEETDRVYELGARSGV